MEILLSRKASKQAYGTEGWKDGYAVFGKIGRLRGAIR